MSTGLDCKFIEVKPGEWYYLLEQWSNRDQYDAYGPFSTSEETYKHLADNHANPGGHSTQRYEEGFQPSESLQELIANAEPAVKENTMTSIAVHDDPLRMLELIHLFRLNHEFCLDPAQARGLCGTASVEWIAYLNENGISGAEQIHGQWQHKVSGGHTCALVGQFVYDWTLRQFEENADVPTITPIEGWRRDWQGELTGVATNTNITNILKEKH